MRKVVLALFIILVAMSLYLLNYNYQFNISDNTYQLQENIKVFINGTSKITNNVEIKQSVEIDNKQYVLFIKDDDSINFAKLTKGFNKKYKINSVESYSSSFRGYIYEINKDKYLIIYGRNDKSISYVKVSIEDKEYKINVPKQEYYIVYSKVSDEIITNFPHIYNYKFYDANDVEIINY